MTSFINLDFFRQQAHRFYQSGDLNQATIFAKRALELARKTSSPDHPQLVRCLNDLAFLYIEQKRYLQAEPLLKQVLDTLKNVFGNDHLYVTEALYNLAKFYERQERYSEAEICYLEELAINKRLFENEHQNVAVNLSDLGLVYLAQGRYTDAETRLKQALEMLKHLLGLKHPDVAASLSNLATLYKAQGRYPKAESLYQEALEILQDLFGEQHPYVANALNNLGSLYKFQGRYSKAEPLLVEALAMRRSFFNDAHPHIAASLDNLAGLYHLQGNYSKAEPLLLEALPIWKHLLGDEHSDVAKCLENLGMLCHTQGRYREAEQYILQSLEMRKHVLGNQHPDVADSLNNLALVYKYQERYSEAEALSKEALEIRKKLWGAKHPYVEQSLHNLAALYEAQGRYREAESLSQEAVLMSMLKPLLGQEDPGMVRSLNGLAVIYHAQGDYPVAESYYRMALEIGRRLLGDEHPDMAVILHNLADLFVIASQFNEALSIQLKATAIDDKMIRNIFAFSSESDRLAYLQKLRSHFEGLLSLIYNLLSDSPQAVQAALDTVFKRKALTASALAAQNEALYSDHYPHLIEQFQKLRDLSEQIIHLTFSIPKTKDFTAHQQQLARLQAEHNNLQKKLASEVPEIQLKEQLPNHRDIASELPAGSVLIEFVRFDVFNFQAVPAKGETKWLPARYLAFILPAGQPESVEMIDIGEAEYIDSLIREFRELVSGAGKDPDSHLGMVSRTSKLIFRECHPQAGIKLRQAIFDKLCPALKEYQHLIISPDGELNLLPFQILPSDDTGEKMLMDEFTISYLTVGRDILRQKIETKRPASIKALVLADPNFDLGSETVTTDAPQTGQSNQAANLRESIANQLFMPATGTDLLGKRIAHKLKVSPYVGSEALETHLNRQCPRILLIATHGKFLPNQLEEPTLSFSYQEIESGLLRINHFSPRTENPMLRSALALAGANTWAKGGKLPKEAENGILFAQDVAGLDLWANEISVLSACETGIGDVAIGEGVFGLRRAFAVAGAKTLIMSLWSVNGWATALLMERFFDNCEAGLGRAEALQEAQNYVRNITVFKLQQFELGREILKYEFNNGRKLNAAILARQAEDKPLSHPYYWGAWICQGDTKPVEIS